MKSGSTFMLKIKPVQYYIKHTVCSVHIYQFPFHPVISQLDILFTQQLLQIQQQHHRHQNWPLLDLLHHLHPLHQHQLNLRHHHHWHQWRHLEIRRRHMLCHLMRILPQIAKLLPTRLDQVIFLFFFRTTCIWTVAMCQCYEVSWMFYIGVYGRLHLVLKYDAIIIDCAQLAYVYSQAVVPTTVSCVVFDKPRIKIGPQKCSTYTKMLNSKTLNLVFLIHRWSCQR